MDQSFSRINLARCLVPKDFYTDNGLNEEIYRTTLVDKAVTLAQESHRFTPNLYVNNASKKPTYSVRNLTEKLVLRKCAKNIREAAKIRLKSRSQIIREARPFLKEGTAYRIYRLDIASFFENCSSEQILDLFLKKRISTQTQMILKCFLSDFNEKCSTGIPRGVETSPVLAELSLIDFDSTLSMLEDVFFYSRFVDDVLIITSGVEDKGVFLNRVRKSLPDSLRLNHNKTSIIDIPNRTTGKEQSVANPNIWSVNYLGYRVSIVDSDVSQMNAGKPSSLRKSVYRIILVDISEKKTKRIMSKISKAFYSFTKHRDYELLKDRLVFLSSNRDLINKVKDRKIPTGIYYSHSEIDYPSKSLDRIDRFLKALINNPQGRIGNTICGKLSKTQKKELLKLKFSEGHKNRVFKRYSPNRLNVISKIW